MAQVVASIAGVFAGAGGFVYGLLTTGSLSGAESAALSASRQAYAAVDPQDALKYQLQADVGNTNQGASTPTPTTTPTTPTSPNVSTNAQTWADIARERYYAQETQIGSMQEQLGAEVGGLETQETQTEGGIRASAAVRGLKLEGSPLMQLISQQEAGQRGIGYAQRQGAAAIEGAGTSAQAGYDAAILAAKENQESLQADLTSSWLQSFSDIMSTAQFAMGMPGANWTPSQSEGPTYDLAPAGNYWDY